VWMFDRVISSRVFDDNRVILAKDRLE
jgi:hypothetical protein